MDTLGDVLILAGAVLSVIAAVGVLRFRDLYSRMHAASKVPTLSLLLVVVGAQFVVDGWGTRATLLLAFVLQLLTAPVGAHLVGRSSYRRTGVELRVDAIDELGRDIDAGATNPDRLDGAAERGLS